MIYFDRWVRVLKFVRKVELFNISFYCKYLNDVFICIVIKKNILVFNKKIIYVDDGIYVRKRMVGSYFCYLFYWLG